MVDKPHPLDDLLKVCADTDAAWTPAISNGQNNDSTVLHR